MPLKPLHLISSLVAPMFVVFACGGTDSGTSSGSNGGGGGGGGQAQTSTGTGGGQPSSAKCTSSCCTENDNTTASTTGTASCKTFCIVRSAAHCENEVMDQTQCEAYFQCPEQDKGKEACVAASKVLMDCYRAQGDSCKAETCCENQAGKVQTACQE